MRNDIVKLHTFLTILSCNNFYLPPGSSTEVHTCVWPCKTERKARRPAVHFCKKEGREACACAICIWGEREAEPERRGQGERGGDKRGAWVGENLGSNLGSNRRSMNKALKIACLQNMPTEICSGE